MNKKKEYTTFHYFFTANSGTWMLILVHLVILISLVVLFSSIIAKMQYY